MLNWTVPLARIALSISVIVGFGVGIAEAASTPALNKVCVSTTGAVTVRAKCKKTEKRASISSLTSVGLNTITGLTGPQGPQGPAGAAGVAGQTGPQGVQGAVGPKGIINFASCYEKNGPLTLFLPIATSSVNCNNMNTEFMLNWSYGTSPVNGNAVSIITAVDLVFNANVPVGVQVTASKASTDNIQVQAFAVCCARQ